jgi:hypothetical protein
MYTIARCSTMAFRRTRLSQTGLRAAALQHLRRRHDLEFASADSTGEEEGQP